MFTDILRGSRAWAPLSLAFLAVACTPGPDDLPPEGTSEPLGVSIEGLPVNCMRPTTVSVDEIPVAVTVSDPGGTEWTATLGAVDVRGQFEAGDPHRAALALEADIATELLIERPGDVVFSCRVSLIYRPAAVSAADALDQASTGGAIYTYSEETGAINGAVIDVPTAGSTPSERGLDFLSEHAAVFGLDASTLRETDQWSSPDGWVTLVYHQYFGDVFGLDSLFELELDDAGRARSVHARVYAGVLAEPTFVLDAGQALALARAEVGEAEEFQRVLYDLSAPKAGWSVEGLEGRALIDDVSGTVVEVDPGYREMPLEIQRTSPSPAPVTSGRGWTRTTVARGDTAAGIPAGLGGAERSVFSVVAAISNEVQRRTGSPGWRGGRGQVVTQAEVREGTVGGRRVAGAFYQPGSPYRFVFLDGNARQRRDTICHEYGHVYDDARAGLGAPAFSEMYGDLFYLFCEGWVSDGPYVYNGSGRVHTGSTPREDQRNYDRFLERGLRETDIGRRGAAASVVPHDFAFLVTIPFYDMMENRGLDREKATALGLSAAAGSYATFPQVRDRILREAVSWARSGRNGFTDEDACAVAQGFRVTRLDGEYGRGAGCGETSRGELTCTSSFCPLCGEAPTVCRPETLASGQPTCMTADGRRTCVGSIATSSDGCSSGTSHHCWCVADGRWDCSTAGPCVADPSARPYCPEDPRSSGARTMAPACSASPAVRPAALVWIGALLASMAWIRQRAGVSLSSSDAESSIS